MPPRFATLWERLRASLTPRPRVDPAQLSDPDPTTRWRAARNLAGSPQPALSPTLLHLLEDPDPIVRDETVRTLASWGPEHTLQIACDRLGETTSPLLAASLLDLLYLTPAPTAAPAISTFLDHTDPLVRAAAARTLGVAGSSQHIPSLLTRATDSDPRVRRAACQSLGRLADPSAVSALSERLHDPDLATRQYARTALTRIEAAQKTETKQSDRQPTGDNPPPSVP